MEREIPIYERLILGGSRSPGGICEIRFNKEESRIYISANQAFEWKDCGNTLVIDLPHALSNKHTEVVIDAILNISHINTKNALYYVIDGSILNSEVLCLEMSGTSKLRLLEASGPIQRMEIFQNSTGFLDGGHCLVNNFSIKTDSTGKTRNFTVANNTNIVSKGTGTIALRLFDTCTEHIVSRKGGAEIMIDRVTPLTEEHQ